MKIENLDVSPTNTTWHQNLRIFGVGNVFFIGIDPDFPCSGQRDLDGRIVLHAVYRFVSDAIPVTQEGKLSLAHTQSIVPFFVTQQSLTPPPIPRIHITPHTELILSEEQQKVAATLYVSLLDPPRISTPNGGIVR